MCARRYTPLVWGRLQARRETGTRESCSRKGPFPNADRAESAALGTSGTPPAPTCICRRTPGAAIRPRRARPRDIARPQLSIGTGGQGCWEAWDNPRAGGREFRSTDGGGVTEMPHCASGLEGLPKANGRPEFVPNYRRRGNCPRSDEGGARDSGSGLRAAHGGRDAGDADLHFAPPPLVSRRSPPPRAPAPRAGPPPRDLAYPFL